MEFIVGSVDNIKFDIEIALEEQHGSEPLPFPGMDSELLEYCVITVVRLSISVVRLRHHCLPGRPAGLDVRHSANHRREPPHTDGSTRRPERFERVNGQSQAFHTRKKSLLSRANSPLFSTGIVF